MLAAKLFGPGDIRVVECEKPVISENEILLKIDAASICGSDLRMIQNGYKNVNQKHPLTLGHEFCGTVAEVGGKVRQYQIGMKVAAAPNYGCGTCGYCVSGNTHLCAEYKAFGINIEGGFAEYVRVPAEVVTQGNLVPADDLSPEAAALIEPMSCVVNGQDKAEIRLFDTVLVIGAGPVGLMHALLARINGATKVIISDLSESRVRQCVNIDPSIVGISGDGLKEKIMEITKGNGVDVCITACSVASVQASAPELMAQGGRILFFGGLPAGKDAVTIPTNYIHYKQLQICGTSRSNIEQYRRVVMLMKAGMLDLQPIVSRKYSILEFNQAIQYAQSGEGLKTVINF